MVDGVVKLDLQLQINTLHNYRPQQTHQTHSETLTFPENNFPKRIFFQVKRLMTDPKDFCCPISHELMKDPVVAGDGHTYERSCIEGAALSQVLSTSKLAKVIVT